MLVTYFVNFRWLNDHLFGKELFIRFTASAFRKLLSVHVFGYFPFGSEGRMWDLIVSVPDHCLSFYFVLNEIMVYLYFLCVELNHGRLRRIEIFFSLRNESDTSAHNQPRYPSNQNSPETA